MRYFAKKTDTTHKAIGAALRSVTRVDDVHEMGKLGCDFIARHIRTGAPIFIEAKSHKKISHRSETKITNNEAKMRDFYPGHWVRCETEEDALRAVGALLLPVDPQKATAGHATGGPQPNRYGPEDPPLDDEPDDGWRR